jgi:hypothetical protein
MIAAYADLILHLDISVELAFTRAVLTFRNINRLEN